MQLHLRLKIHLEAVVPLSVDQAIPPEMKYISCLCRTIEHSEKPTSQLENGLHAVLRPREYEWRDLRLFCQLHLQIKGSIMVGLLQMGAFLAFDDCQR